MYVIGLDIGGANIKAADNDGQAVSRPFALWKEPGRLPVVLRHLLGTFSRQPGRVAVTMTAELCDCFQTKAEGVDFILAAVEEVAGGIPVSVWQTGGEFVPPSVARDIPLLVAAANWHALATFCGRMVPRGTALLIDVGSTTTDIIPLLDGKPVATGLTDFERLKAGELVYTGVRRTPVCAVATAVELDGETVPLSAELFATMLDVYLLTGDIPEDGSDSDTANGRPATKTAAIDRLARMLCCDRSEIEDHEIHSMAMQIASAQLIMLAHAMTKVLERIPTPCGNDILSGSGEFLAKRLAANHAALSSIQPTALSQMLSPGLAASACAFSVAKLAAECV